MHSRFLRSLAVIAAAASVGCSRERDHAPVAPALPAAQVSLATVQREVAPVPIEIPGTVRPAERAIIAAKISGTIDALPITLGQVVQHGDLLVRLAAPELTARLAQARAQLDQSTREEKRNRELAATGADTADAARAAEERLRGSRAAVAEAEAMLAYTEIRAPYDGRIAQKFVYAGALATPGAPLLEIDRAAALQIEAAVPASLATSLKLDADVPVQISGATVPMIAHVAEVAAAADPATHTVLAKFSLTTSDATLSGRAARVTLAGPVAESLSVPGTAVTRFGQMERVFVVAENRAQLRLVKTGAVHGDRIEVLAGIAAGENIVVAPPTTLRDGQPVTTAP